MRVLLVIAMVSLGLASPSFGECLLSPTQQLAKMFSQSPEALGALGKEVQKLSERYDAGETWVVKELQEKKILFSTAFKENVKTTMSGLQKQQISASEKAALWRKAGEEFSRIRPGWKMTEIASPHGQYVFWGSGGYTLVIDADGILYRGEMGERSFQAPLQWIDIHGPKFWPVGSH